MSPIPIISCHNCKPDLWKVINIGKGEYKCQKCGKIINEVLKRKEN